MTTILISLVLVVFYFIVVGIKENETREAVDRERRISNKKIADIHFQNMVQNELNKQKFLKEAHDNFIIELENEDYIEEAIIIEDNLNIVIKHFIYEEDAQEFANNFISSLNTSTGINVINVFDTDKIVIATAKRK